MKILLLTPSSSSSLARLQKLSASEKFTVLSAKTTRQLGELSDDLAASVANASISGIPVKWCAVDIKQVYGATTLIERAAKSDASDERTKNVKKVRNIVRTLGRACQP